MKSKIRVALMSRHAVPNYGSLLQSYALQRVLEKMGCDPFYIDAEFCYYSAMRSAKAGMEVSRWRRVPFLNLAAFLTKYRRFYKPIKMFRKYQKEWLYLSPEQYFNYEQLEKNYPIADVYMVGSDQVWNIMPDGKIEASYFLNFLKGNECKVSYASSFGSKAFLEPYMGQIREYLSDFQYITVREQDGLSILASLGLQGKQVVDPTLLLPKEEWENLAQKRSPITDDYLLVYQVNGNKSICQYGEKLAKSMGIKFVRISADPYEKNWAEGYYYLPTPDELLCMFKNAKYVVTDSFHGTCFCILFNKQFVDVLPEKFSERNKSILTLTGLSDRIVQENDYETIEKPINWIHVNECIKKARCESMQILKKIICDGEDKNEG